MKKKQKQQKDNIYTKKRKKRKGRIKIQKSKRNLQIIFFLEGEKRKYVSNGKIRETRDYKIKQKEKKGTGLKNLLIWKIFFLPFPKLLFRFPKTFAFPL